LQALAAANPPFDLTAVEEIAIGLGGQDGVGMIVVDWVQLRPTRCLAPIAPEDGDLNDDCSVDLLDFAKFAGNWLNSNIWP